MLQSWKAFCSAYFAHRWYLLQELLLYKYAVSACSHNHIILVFFYFKAVKDTLDEQSFKSIEELLFTASDPVLDVIFLEGCSIFYQKYQLDIHVFPRLDISGGILVSRWDSLSARKCVCYTKFIWSPILFYVIYNLRYGVLRAVPVWLGSKRGAYQTLPINIKLFWYITHNSKSGRRLRKLVFRKALMNKKGYTSHKLDELMA